MYNTAKEMSNITYHSKRLVEKEIVYVKYEVTSKEWD